MSPVTAPHAIAGPTASSRDPLGIRRQVRESIAAVGRIRLLDFLLFAALAFPQPIGGAGIAYDLLAVAAISCLALFRRPRRDLSWVQPLIPLFVAALLYLAVVSSFAVPTEEASDWHRRLLRLVLMTGFAFMISSGRIDLRSGVFGLATSLLVNAPLFYAGLVPDTYDGYLTGILLDKNYAGLVYCVVGVALLGVLRSPRLRAMSFVGFAGLLWLTGSRTSLAAFAAATLWMLIAPRLPLIGRAILGVLIYTGVNLMSEDFSQVGAFSNRVGSDLLRSRIDAASQIKVGGSGFFGLGLGEAYVSINDQHWFFHNSYWSAQVEGGWPWLLFVVGVTVLLVIRPFQRPMSLGDAAVQGAGVALLVCAWRLGEVFYTLPWALVLGLAIEHCSPPLHDDGMRPLLRASSGRAWGR